MTPEQKTEIDGMNYCSLLARWRFAPCGDPMFQGEVGAYYQERMNTLRAMNPAQAVADSKSVGWDR